MGIRFEETLPNELLSITEGADSQKGDRKRRCWQPIGCPTNTFFGESSPLGRVNAKRISVCMHEDRVLDREMVVFLGIPLNQAEKG